VPSAPVAVAPVVAGPEVDPGPVVDGPVDAPSSLEESPQPSAIAQATVHPILTNKFMRPGYTNTRRVTADLDDRPDLDPSLAACAQLALSTAAPSGPRTLVSPPHRADAGGGTRPRPGLAGQRGVRATARSFGG
jgi:hypothetical protein